MGMVLYGMDNTRMVTDEMMINHARAVKQAAHKSLVFFDLPFKKKFDEKEMIARVKNIYKKTRQRMCYTWGKGKGSPSESKASYHVGHCGFLLHLCFPVSNY